MMLLMGCLGGGGSPPTANLSSDLLENLTAFLDGVAAERGLPSPVLREVKPFNGFLVTYRVGSTEVSFLVTSDGMVSPYSPVNISTLRPPEQQRLQPREVPNATLFLMAQCPHGGAAALSWSKLLLEGFQLDFQPAYILFPDYHDPEVHCVEVNGSKFCSMHGRGEVLEDAYQKAAYDLFGAEGWALGINSSQACYASCPNSSLEAMGLNSSEIYSYLENGTFFFLEQALVGLYGEEILWAYKDNLSSCRISCFRESLAAAGYDTSALDEYYEENLLSILQGEEEKTLARGVSASPTLFLNGQVFEGNLGMASYFQLLCQAYLQPPALCQQGPPEEDQGTGGVC